EIRQARGAEPHRPAQGGRPRRGPHRRPAQDHRHRSLRLRAPRRRAEPGLRLPRGERDRQGADHADGHRGGQGRPRRARGGHDARDAAPHEGPDERRLAVRRRRGAALPPGDRGRGRRDVRAGARGRGAHPRGLRAATRPLRPRDGSPEGAPGQREFRRGELGAGDAPGRRLRGRVRRRAGDPRRHVHHARREPRDDGAPRDDRRVGGREAHGVDLEPDDRLDEGRPGADPRHPGGERPRRLALRRGRVRRQAVPPRRRGAGGARRPGGRAPGEARAHPTAGGEQHHAPPGDHPAHPPRRHPRRPAHRDRAREHERRPPRGRPGDRSVADPAAVRRRQPADRAAPGGARPPRGERDARPGRGARDDGPRGRDGRDGRAARDGPRPVPHRQRHPGRPGEARPPLLRATAHRVPATRRRAVRLGAAQPAARGGARRALAGRDGDGGRVPQQPGDQVGGARPARRAGNRDGRDRHDRHRHGELHGHRPDRRGDDGRRPRSSRREARRLGLPGVVGVGRPVGGQQRDGGRLRRLHEAARGGGGEARARRRRGHVRRRPGARRRAERGAGGRGARGRARRRRPDRVRRPREAVPAVDVRRALRRGGGGRLHRGDAGAAHARGVRGGAHPQPQDRAQPGDRRDDDGRGRSADGGAGGRHALRLLRQPRPRRVRGAGARRHPAPGRRLPRRGRRQVVADEGQGGGRARAVRRRRGGRERGLQRHRRARARLPDHARQAPRPAAGGHV
ncbi:MAG: Periplasmic aromatic aldehyde oxidoreductase, molybdenum binding subunit YagR, partial [uncultured Gemmatimonadaceae bacterium]